MNHMQSLPPRILSQQEIEKQRIITLLKSVWPLF
jgi:hypothetical protein